MIPSPEQHKAALDVAVSAFKIAWRPSNASRALAIEIAIRAYLSALPEQTGERWQPIADVPPGTLRILGWDGTEVVTLDWRPSCRIGLNDHIEIPGAWVQVSDSGRESTFFPTHFMPLPAPPAGEAS